MSQSPLVHSCSNVASVVGLTASRSYEFKILVPLSAVFAYRLITWFVWAVVEYTIVSLVNCLILEKSGTCLRAILLLSGNSCHNFDKSKGLKVHSS